MNPGLPILVTFIPLAVMVRSDIRTRRVSVYWLLLFLLAAFVSAGLYLGGTTMAGRLKINLTFLLLLYIFLGFYVCVVRRRAFLSFTGTIGLGDLIFLPALSPFFELRDFVLFLTVAFLFSLGIYGLFKLFGKDRSWRSIPLISTVGICFMVYIPVMLWKG